MPTGTKFSIFAQARVFVGGIRTRRTGKNYYTVAMDPTDPPNPTISGDVSNPAPIVYADSELPDLSQEQVESIHQKANELQQRIEDLQRVGKVLKEEFVGIDTQIDAVLNAIRPWYLLPETLQRPIVIGLWGRTGVGKTSLVTRIVQLLKIESRYAYEDLGKFTSGDYVAGPEGLGIFDRFLGFSGVPCIFLFDEIHTARTRTPSGDVDRPNLRDLWTFLDTGKIARDTRQIESLLFQFVDRLKFCKSANGPALRPEDISLWEVESLRRALGITKSVVDVRDSWTRNPIQFFEWAIKNLRTALERLSMADFSQSLVFLAGNVEEAFVGSEVMDPNWTLPDDLYENTTKVTLNDVKQALLARFRPEQVARMGSTHVIFPGFNHSHFKQLIQRKLNDLSDKVEKKFNIRLYFHSSVHDLLYEEAVIPTQGARPVLSIVSEYIGSQVPSWVTGVRMVKGEEHVDLTIRYQPFTKQLKAEGIEAPPDIQEFFVSQPALSQSIIRQTQFDPVLRHVVAVHEAGHTVVGITMLGLLPKQITAPAFHSEYGGQTDFGDMPAMTTSELTMQRLAICFGGLAAEELVFGEKEITSGSSYDLRSATILASQGVTQFGMGDHLGHSGIDASNPDTLTTLKPQDDKAKEKWLQIALGRARDAVKAQQPFLSAIVRNLVERPVLSQELLKNIFLEYYEAPDKIKQDIIKRKRPQVYEAYLDTARKFLESQKNTSSRGNKPRKS